MLTTRQLFGFLKSDEASGAPSERTAQEAADAMNRAEGTMRETQKILQQQAQQTKTLSVFTVVTTMFLPLSFATSVRCLPSQDEYFLTRIPISISA